MDQSWLVSIASRRWNEAEDRGTHATLQGSAVHVVAVQLADGHGSILVGVHLDKGETTVGLEARLDDIAEVGEQGDKIVLCGVGGQVTDVAGGLPARSLANNHVVAVHTVGGEMVVSVRRGGSHSHGLHGGLLGDGGLSLLIGPVATDGTRTKPLAVHGTQSLLSLAAVAEGDEAITTRAASLHIPHDTGLGNRAEGGERLHQDFIVNLVGEITHKDVEVVGSVLLAGGVGLVSPVDADLLYGVSLPRER